MWTAVVVAVGLMVSGLILGCLGGNGPRSYFCLGATIFGSLVFACVRPVYGKSTSLTMETLYRR